MNPQSKADKIIWYLLVTAVTLAIAGGAGWANHVNHEIEKITDLRVDVASIRMDVQSIKSAIELYMLRTR